MTQLPTTRAALYARVSGERQVQDDTIASQLDLLDRRIAADGLTVPAELRFVDDGFRGDTLLRPALERLRDIAAAGAIDRLYVECPDRFAREYAYQMVVFDELCRHGVEVVFLNRALDRTPEGRPLLQAQAMIAEYERARIRERTRRGRLFAARSGEVSVLGKAPYGYRYVTKAEGGGQARYVVDFAEARVVKDIFTWSGIEGDSLARIRRRLEAAGIPTRSGNATWDRATLLGLLRNPAYMGEARYPKIQVVPARPRLRPRRGTPEFPRRPTGKRPTAAEDQFVIAVPAIIEPALFAAAQERSAAHRRHPGQAAVAPRHLLAGLVVCRRCGYAYRGRVQGKARPGRRGYYRCRGSEADRLPGRIRACDNPSIRVDRLDEAVWSDVRGLLLEPGRLIAEFERRLSAGAPEGAGAASGPGRDLEKLIERVTRRIDRLVEMYAEGYIEKPEFQREIAAARKRLAALEAERGAVREERQQREELRLIIGRIEEFAEQVRAGLDGGDAAVRRRIICALVKQVEIDADEVHIVYRVNPRPFAQTPGPGDNMPVCRERPDAPCGGSDDGGCVGSGPGGLAPPATP